MDAARDLQIKGLYSRHSRSIDHSSWSVVSDIRWGDVDSVRSRSQPRLIGQLRSILLELSARGAATARLLPMVADDPHAAATFTLELWENLKHLHALRTYLDVVDAGSVSDEELRSVRAEAGAERQCATAGEAVLRLMLAQHASTLRWRRLATEAEEPVLLELIAHLAGDEVRRAQITGDLLSFRLTEKRESVEAVRDQLERLRRSHLPEAVDEVTMQGFVQRIERLCNDSQSSSRPLSRT